MSKSLLIRTASAAVGLAALLLALRLPARAAPELQRHSGERLCAGYGTGSQHRARKL